ncbi:MAG: class I SAM-dependent methyltransferase [Pseudomonadales bacterium]|jgi:cyclopropane fatty-acyl-phospholipid synthase-like methyltransferase|nr:class I SAM-dependent methyltransferase [Pseudomonadales bacterium]
MSEGRPMPDTEADLFAHKAADYDRRPGNLEALERIGATLIGRVELAEHMALMDFGAGTGLLLQQLAPHVGRITAVDVSPAMHAKLREKLAAIPCEVELLALDLECSDLEATFDGIVSSLTLHHIRDVGALLRRLAACVRTGGFIALADLDAEDGRFHEPGTEGVHHHGFERAALRAQVEAAGFRDVEFVTATVIEREGRDYPIFLLTARR